MAETYRIYDYKRVPGRLLGTLVAGLGVDSRVYMKMAGQDVPTSVLMTALVVDELRRITYLINTSKDKEYPESMAALLMEETKPKKEEKIFSTPEEFDKARARLIKRGNHGG